MNHSQLHAISQRKDITVVASLVKNGTNIKEGEYHYPSKRDLFRKSMTIMKHQLTMQANLSSHQACCLGISANDYYAAVREIDPLAAFYLAKKKPCPNASIKEKINWFNEISFEMEESQYLQLLVDFRSSLSTTEKENIATLRINNKNLQSLPSWLNEFTALKKLNFTNCFMLSTVFPQIESMRFLETLDLTSCRKITSITSEIRKVTNLQRLCLSYCESLQSISIEIGKLEQLSVLDLQGCHNIRFLPEEIGMNLSLTKLNLFCCTSLKKLPNLIANLKDLRELTLVRCEALEALPVEIGGLISLETLDLSCCYSLMSIPKEIGLLRNLRELNLRNCIKITNLPSELYNLPLLKNIDTLGTKVPSLLETAKKTCTVCAVFLSGVYFLYNFQSRE